jgi:ParB family transcriptional regulator, chromosome partitioning protein
MSISSLSLPIDELSVREIRVCNPLRKDIGDIGALSRSIDQLGLLQPIVVRPLDDYFDLVAGHRRLEACKRLRWRKIPCHVVELSDKAAFEVALSENLDRKTLDPLEEGRAFQKYVTMSGWGGLTELSKRIGLSPSYISKRIALLSLPEEVIDQILRNRKIPSLAEELLSLDTNSQVEVARAIENQGLSTRDVRKLVKTINLEKSSDGGERPEKLWAVQDDRSKLVVRCIDLTITALRLALSRMDIALEKLDKEWIEKEMILQYRLTLHDQIDSLIRLKKKISSS